MLLEVPECHDPLEWHKANASRFPNLSAVAKAICGSQIENERKSSISGY
jgi:hypothetical protein